MMPAPTSGCCHKLLHQGCERPYFFICSYYDYTYKVQGRQLRP